MAQIDHDKLELAYEQVAVDQLCGQIVKWLQTPTNETHTITITGAQDPLTTYADVGLLRQAVTNLLTNAIKYSPEGSTIVVGIDAHDSMLEISVRDQGIGIPLDEQDMIFDAFRRASNVGEVHGTGIGLMVVKVAAERHQGSVDFVSVPGKGTTFTIRIPHLTAPPAA